MSTPKTSTTVKFSLENPFYQWPASDPMDHQILISKLSDLKASLTVDEWKDSCVLDPNDLLRDLESGKLAVVFAFKADLRFPMAVAHLPFMCRQSGTALVEMKAGAAQEFGDLLQVPQAKKSTSTNNLFMFALRKDVAAVVDRFSDQFPKQSAIDPNHLPSLIVKRTTK